MASVSQTHRKPAPAAPIGYRYACKPDGTNTGLSHYILLDPKK